MNWTHPRAATAAILVLTFAFASTALAADRPAVLE